MLKRKAYEITSKLAAGRETIPPLQIEAFEMRKLTRDQLGGAGEALFQYLAEQGGLTVNKSSRDRSGWDFLVQFPISEDASDRLDRRRSLPCYVQLKSTAIVGPSSVRMSLSMAEELAKLPAQSLLIVFKLDPSGNPKCGYLIHLINEELERILLRLTEAQIGDGSPLHKQTVSFDYHKIGRRFDLTPEGLRTAIQESAGGDPTAYVQEKQRQLAQAGYEDGGFEADATIFIESKDHLVRMLAGLTPMRPQELTLYDKRFGIRLPYDGEDFIGKEFFLTPPVVGRAEIIIRGPALTTASVFDASIHVLNLPGEVQTMIKAEDVSVIVSDDGLKFSSVDLVGGSKRNLHDWKNLLQAVAYLKSGRSKLSLSLKRSGGAPVDVSFPIDEAVLKGEMDEAPATAAFVGRWIKLLQWAGIQSTCKVELNELWDARLPYLAADMLLNPNSPGFLEVGDWGLPNTEGGFDAVYYNSCALGEDAISFAVKITFRPTGEADWSFRSATITPLDVSPRVEDIHEYGRDIARNESIKVLLNPDLIDHTYRDIKLLG